MLWSLGRSNVILFSLPRNFFAPSFFMNVKLHCNIFYNVQTSRFHLGQVALGAAHCTVYFAMAGVVVYR